MGCAARRALDLMMVGEEEESQCLEQSLFVHAAPRGERVQQNLM